MRVVVDVLRPGRRRTRAAPRAAGPARRRSRRRWLPARPWCSAGRGDQRRCDVRVGDATGESARRVRLPAVQAQLRRPARGNALIPVAAPAPRPAVPVGLVVDTTRMPTPDEEDTARAAELRRPGGGLPGGRAGATARNGGLLLALLIGTTVITLGAAGIATGLAAADGRADLATLAAVGAAPRTRRLLAGAQALIVACARHRAWRRRRLRSRGGLHQPAAPLHRRHPLGSGGVRGRGGAGPRRRSGRGPDRQPAPPAPPYRLTVRRLRRSVGG